MANQRVHLAELAPLRTVLGAGYQCEPAERIAAAAALVQQALDDPYKSDLADRTTAAVTAIGRILNFLISTADKAEQQYAAAEGALQSTLAAMKSEAWGAQDNAIDLRARRNTVLKEARKAAANTIFEQTKGKAGELARAARVALKDLAQGIVRAKAIATLPEAMTDPDEDLLSLSKRAALEQSILSRPKPAAYVLSTWQTLVQVGEAKRAEEFARAARYAMRDTRDTPPPKLSARYANMAPDTIQSERTAAFEFCKLLEQHEQKLFASSSVAVAEQAYNALWEVWRMVCGVHMEWLSPAETRSRYMIDITASKQNAADDAIVTDYPRRFLPDGPGIAKLGWSRVVSKLPSGALVRAPKP
jgi:hypothetical protein